jgi:hypothetical protein
MKISDKHDPFLGPDCANFPSEHRNTIGGKRSGCFPGFWGNYGISRNKIFSNGSKLFPEAKFLPFAIIFK